MNLISQRASRVGPEGVHDDQTQKGRFCPCCSRHTHRARLPMCVTINQLSFLGPGYPLYFVFLKYAIILVLLLILISGVFNLTSNVIKSDCSGILFKLTDGQIDFNIFDSSSPSSQTQNSTQNQTSNSTSNATKNTEDDCNSRWFQLFNFANQRYDQTLKSVQEILNLILIFMIIFALQLLRKSLREMSVECDGNDIGPNDYTIMVSNIPKQIKNALNDDYDDDILDFFQKNLETEKPLQVVQVILCYNIEELIQIDEKINDCINKKKQTLIRIQKTNSFKGKTAIQEIDKEIRSLFEQKHKLEKNFFDGQDWKFMKDKFTGHAFVSFELESMRDDILKSYEPLSILERLIKPQKKIIYREQELEISFAANPTDVYWENLYIDLISFIQRNTISFIANVAFMGICFLIIYYQTMLQKYLKRITDPQYLVFVDVLVALVVAILNKLIQIILIQLSQQFIVLYFIKTINEYFYHFFFQILGILSFEGHYTRTHCNISIVQKLSVLLFVNTAIFPFVVIVLLAPNDQSLYKTIYGDEGVVSQVIYIFIINGFLPIIVELINPEGIFKGLLREVEQQKGKNKSVMTQQELNELYENPEFDVVLRYTETLRNLYITALYSPLIPLGAFIEIASILGFYWVDKYNLLRRHIVKYNLGTNLSIEMTEMMEYVLPVFSFANLMFFYFIEQDLGKRALSIVGLTIGILHAFLPMQYFNQKFLQVKQKQSNDNTYHDFEPIFPIDYGRANPATSYYCKQEFFSKYDESHPNHIKNNPNQVENLHSHKIVIPPKGPKNDIDSRINIVAPLVLERRNQNFDDINLRPYLAPNYQAQLQDGYVPKNQSTIQTYGGFIKKRTDNNYDDIDLRPYLSPKFVNELGDNIYQGFQKPPEAVTPQNGLKYESQQEIQEFQFERMKRTQSKYFNSHQTEHVKIDKELNFIISPRGDVSPISQFHQEQ